MRRALIFGWLISVSAGPVQPDVQLKRSCTRCHRLNVVRAQHLSREEWAAELNKMVSMGAKVPDRKLLLDYLTKKYGAK